MRLPSKHVLKITYPLVLSMQYEIKIRFAVPEVLVRHQCGKKKEKKKKNVEVSVKF